MACYELEGVGGEGGCRKERERSGEGQGAGTLLFSDRICFLAVRSFSRSGLHGYSPGQRWHACGEQFETASVRSAKRIAWEARVCSIVGSLRKRLCLCWCQQSGGHHYQPFTTAEAPLGFLLTQHDNRL